MVKADAYGHGIKTIVDYTYNSCGIKNFGVASISELAEIETKMNAKFWVFSELDLEKNKKKYESENVLPVISSLAELKELLNLLPNKKFALKFNTGMNRLGIDEEEIDDLIKLLRSFSLSSIEHLMTHFSSSYFKIDKQSQTSKQYQNFKRIKKRMIAAGFSYKGSSCSNSGAIEQSFGLDESHIRPGLMLYGPASFGLIGSDKSEWQGEPLSSLNSKIIKVKYFEKGEAVGYGGVKLKKGAFIAHIPIGYGDGVLNYYSGVDVFCGKTKGRIFGRINMDLCAIEFDQEVKVGDEIRIWGQNLTEFCTQVKSIPYQVMTSVSRRIPRIYEF